MANNEQGVQQIYARKMGGEARFLDSTKDDFYRIGGDSDRLSGNNDDGFELDDWSKVRFSLETSDGYDGDEETNYSTCAKRGYMEDPEDWRNTEGTIYIRHEDGSGDDQYVLYTRGGTHTGSGDCRGCAYKGDLYFSGKVRFAKEEWHVSYEFTDPKSAIGDIEGKWIGLKFMVYNINDNKAVVLELWLDKNNDNSWKKYDDTTDDGGWGSNMDHCDAPEDDSPITWGGPLYTFRVDNADDAKFKNFSVVEINEEATGTPTDPGNPTDPSGGGEGEAPGTPSGPDFPPPPQVDVILSKHWTDLFHIAIDTGESCSIGGQLGIVPTVELYNVVAPDAESVNWFDLFSTSFQLGGLQINDSESVLLDTTPYSVTVTIKKIGNPTGTDNNIYLAMYDSDENLILTFDNFVNAGTLVAGTETQITFTSAAQLNPASAKALKRGRRLAIKYAGNGSDNSNKLQIKRSALDPIDSDRTRWTEWHVATGWKQNNDYDIIAIIEGYPRAEPLTEA